MAHWLARGTSKGMSIYVGHYLSMLSRGECLLALGTLEAEAVPIFTEGGLSLS